MAEDETIDRRIWVVSELYYPEDTSTGYYLTRIAEGLAQRSAQPVHVLCGRPTYAARGQTTATAEVHRGVTIRRCRGTTWNKDHLLGRLANLFTLSFSMLLHGIWRFRRGDRVLVVTNPPLLPFMISWACRLRGATCVLLIHDVYPDVAVAAGLLKEASPFTRSLDWAVGRLYRAMEQIIVLGRDMRERVLQKLPPGDARLTIIPNWSDTDLIQPQSGENRIIRELGLSQKFVVQYAGNMGRAHNLEAVVEVARRLEYRDDIHFLLVGSGAKKAWLTETVKELRLKNITIADRRPRADLPDLLTAGDVALISFVPGMAGISVPSRMYNVLAAGKPIIALTDAHSELAQLIEEEQVGWVVPADDLLAFQNAILAACANRNQCQVMGQQARQAAESTYQYDRILDAYVEILEPHGLHEVQAEEHHHFRAA